MRSTIRGSPVPLRLTLVAAAGLVVVRTTVRHHQVAGQSESLNGHARPQPTARILAPEGNSERDGRHLGNAIDSDTSTGHCRLAAAVTASMAALKLPRKV